ncbi:MAG: hypothetical protein WA210_19570 [Burkholderiaceae bacterium]
MRIKSHSAIDLRAVLAGAIVTLAPATRAGEPQWYMHAGGLSYHFEQTHAANRQWREQHAGLGVERRANDGNAMEWRWAGGLMQDSRSFWGGYAGTAYMRRWHWAGVGETGLGLGAYAIYRSSNWRGDMKLTPGLLPTASINMFDNRFGFNIIYIPPLAGGGEKLPSVVHAQMVVRFP